MHIFSTAERFYGGNAIVGAGLPVAVGLGLADQDGPLLRALVRAYGGLVQEVTLEWLERGRLTQDQARTILVQTLPLLLERVLPALGEDLPQR